MMLVRSGRGALLGGIGLPVETPCKFRGNNKVIGVVMPRAISKTAIDFGRIRIGADEISVWVDREAKQLIVGDREFELSQLPREQLDQLEAMARLVRATGETNDAVRDDLAVLVAELIHRHTH